MRSVHRLLMLLACLPLAAQGVSQTTAPYRGVDHARLTSADRRPGEWMAPGRTYGEQRVSPLDQIHADNAAKLGLAWYADIKVDRGVEASPLMVDGVLYNIEPWNVTVAYDAATGRELWRFDP